MALTEKQKNFCRNIVSGMSNKDAYLSAYDSKSDNAAWIESTKLLQKDDIQDYIKALSKPIETIAQSKAISERERKRSVLWDIIENGDNNDKCRALDILNKMDSEYVNINRNIEDKPAEIINLDTDSLKRLADGF